jgi:tetratricopeptide (TPR) repeat protein
LILSLSGTVCRNDGRVDEALDFYSSAMNFDFDAPQLRATIAYHRGSCYFMKNEWLAAIHHFELFLKTTTGNAALIDCRYS